MNKKLIAIAVASVMAAPVAMADIKISGRVNQQFVNVDVDGGDASTGLSDSGHTRLQFDGTAGNAYARIALDERLGRIQDNNDEGRVKRDNYVGYKFGGGTSIQFGRMGTAGKNIEKDPLIATFLETRSSVANAKPGDKYSSSSFVDQVGQFKMKAGAATVKVQLGLADSGDAAAPATNQGYTAVSVTGKAGGVKYWFSYNNDSGDQVVGNDDSNLKLGATMKFGKVATTLNYETHDDDGASNEAITVRANMGFGDGLTGYAGIGLASGDGGSAADATWLRLAVSKKLSKGASLYGGYTSTDFDDASGNADFSMIGVGMTVKF